MSSQGIARFSPVRMPATTNGPYVIASSAAAVSRGRSETSARAVGAGVVTIAHRVQISSSPPSFR
jgi:hypothetical protein